MLSFVQVFVVEGEVCVLDSYSFRPMSAVLPPFDINNFSIGVRVEEVSIFLKGVGDEGIGEVEPGVGVMPFSISAFMLGGIGEVGVVS
jgi:hypothetical protein